MNGALRQMQWHGFYELDRAAQLHQLGEMQGQLCAHAALKSNPKWERRSSRGKRSLEVTQHEVQTAFVFGTVHGWEGPRH